MTECPITGDAEVERVHGTTDQLQWTRADPETHVSTELLDQLDPAGMQFLLAKYKLGDPCPHWPRTRHAYRRDA
jgi:hypothetical protein